MKCRKLTKKAFRKTLMYKAFVIGLYNLFMGLADVMYVAESIDVECDIPHAKVIIKKEKKDKSE